VVRPACDILRWLARRWTRCQTSRFSPPHPAPCTCRPGRVDHVTPSVRVRAKSPTRRSAQWVADAHRCTSHGRNHSARRRSTATDGMHHDRRDVGSARTTRMSRVTVCERSVRSTPIAGSNHGGRVRGRRGAANIRQDTMLQRGVSYTRAALAVEHHEVRAVAACLRMAREARRFTLDDRFRVSRPPARDPSRRSAPPTDGSAWAESF